MRVEHAATEGCSRSRQIGHAAVIGLGELVGTVRVAYAHVMLLLTRHLVLLCKAIIVHFL